MKASGKFDGVLLAIASLAAMVLAGFWGLSTADPGERLMGAGIAVSVGVGLLVALFSRGKRIPYAPLRDWYTVSFDEHALQVHCAPPGHEAWGERLPWSGIARAELVEEGLSASDRVRLVSREGGEPLLEVPIEADGGREFLQELLRRDLLDVSFLQKQAFEKQGMLPGCSRV